MSDDPAGELPLPTRSIDQLLADASRGDAVAAAELFERHRPGLESFVRARLDPRLRSRVDPADVLQESYLDMRRRLENYCRHASRPFTPWLKKVVRERLLRVHRRLLAVDKRSALREVRLDDVDDMLETSANPSERREIREIFMTRLRRLDPIDQEVLVLRVLEELTNVEAAERLGVTVTAASNRYVRALARFQRVFLDRE